MACNLNRDKMSTFMLATNPTVRDQQSSSESHRYDRAAAHWDPLLADQIRALTMSIVGANAARDLPPLGSAPHFEFSTATDKP
jgi:hypothetical protein